VLLLLGGWLAALLLAVGVGAGLRWRRAPVVLTAAGLTAAVGLAVWGAAAAWPGFAYTWYAQAAWLAALAGLVAVELTPLARAGMPPMWRSGRPTSQNPP